MLVKIPGKLPDKRQSRLVGYIITSIRFAFKAFQAVQQAGTTFARTLCTKTGSSFLKRAMIDAGFFVKRIEGKPDNMRAPGVIEICSVSGCLSSPPKKWIESWRHNDFGWFNHIADALSVVPAGDESRYRLFAYRLYPEVFTAQGRVPIRVPENVRPEPIPAGFRRLGFDSASKSMERVLGFECSPLSCNLMATEINANQFCLFADLDRAIAGAERFAAEQPEPGDYYVVEVLERG